MPSKSNKKFSIPIKTFKLSDLKQADKNPRVSIRDDEEFYTKLERSITKLGYIDPIIVNIKNGKNTIVAGNQRYTILCDKAKDEGLSLDDCEVDVVPVEFNEDMELTANIAHNNIHGDWLNTQLREDLQDLKCVSDDLLELTGFDEDQLAEMLAADDVDDSEDDMDNRDFCLKVYLPQEYEQLFDFYISLHSEDAFKDEIKRLLTGAKQ